MDSVRSKVFNFFLTDVESTDVINGQQNFPSKDEIAKKFEERRKKFSKKKLAKSKTVEKLNQAEQKKRAKKMSIKELLRQKAEKSLSQLAASGFAATSETKMKLLATGSSAAIKNEKPKAFRKPPETEHNSGETGLPNKGSTLLHNFNDGVVSTTQNSTGKKLIVVREWDGQCNSYLMNLNMKIDLHERL